MAECEACKKAGAAHDCASAWVLDAWKEALLALADEVPHIRKSETACTVACPACRLRAKVEEALSEG